MYICIRDRRDERNYTNEINQNNEEARKKPLNFNNFRKTIQSANSIRMIAISDNWP